MARPHGARRHGAERLCARSPGTWCAGSLPSNAGKDKDGILGFCLVKASFFFLRLKKMQTFPDVENNKNNDNNNKKKQEKQKNKKTKKNNPHNPHQTGRLGEEGKERKIKNRKKSSAPASLLMRASGARPRAPRSPRLRFGRRLPAPGSPHSLSERVSYWEQSRGLGSSSQAWCCPPGVPCGSGTAGAAVTTPLGSRMVSGL